MRDITEIFIHAASTKVKHNFTKDDIERWHTDPKPKGNGWSTIGYHYVILRDGTVQEALPIEKAGIHARGHNTNSIGICLMGGKGDDGKPQFNFTIVQMDALESLIDYLEGRFPNAEIRGHNEVSTKPCPCFNVKVYFGDR